MLKFTGIALLSLMTASSSLAFTMGQHRPSATRLYSTTQKVDASSAIAEAMRVSKQYGIHSPEAAVAWDAVEEMNAADNR